MLRKYIFIVAYLTATAFPALSYEIRSSEPETGFPETFDATILGLKIGISAEDALPIVQAEYADTRINESRLQFPETDTVFVETLWVSRGNRERLTIAFSSPASFNRAYAIKRETTFQRDQQPLIADLQASLKAKYGTPSFADQYGNWYYTFMNKVPLSLPAELVEQNIKGENPTFSTEHNIITNDIRSCVDNTTDLTQFGNDLQHVFKTMQNAACNAHLKIRFSRGISENHVGRFEIGLSDFMLRMSSAKIDNQAVEEALKEQKENLPSAAAPKL